MLITNDSFLKLSVAVFGLILSPIVTKVGYLIVVGLEKLTRLFEKRNVLTQKTSLEVNKWNELRKIEFKKMENNIEDPKEYENFANTVSKYQTSLSEKKTTINIDPRNFISTISPRYKPIEAIWRTERF